MEFSKELIELGEKLHNRLIEGDITVTSEIAETFLPILTPILEEQNPGLADPQLVDLAVEDTILNYLFRPEQYKSEKKSLPDFLLMSARADLKNYQARRKEGRFLVDRDNFVELTDDNVETITDQSFVPIEDEIISKESPVYNKIQTLITDPVDLEIVGMMMSGIRETTEFAKVMGISDLPETEQERQVKRSKDRLKKQIQRHISRSELDDE